jgi:hypothetical protein
MAQRKRNAGAIRDLELVANVVDLTSATEDYPLSVNETAKITISAASTPLNIAVEDGVYEIDLIFDRSTFAADRSVGLQANNATGVGLYTFEGIQATVASTTMQVLSTDEHRFTGGILSRPIACYGRLYIFGTNSTLLSHANGTTLAGDSYLYETSTRRSSFTHTSLGTLVTGEACTGVAYVKRIA